MTPHFLNPDDIAGSAALLLAQARALPEDAAPDVRTEAKYWLAGVEENIDRLPAGGLLPAIGRFDAVHRLAYGTPADTRFLDRYKLNAFEARMGGDMSVDQYTLQRTISHELRRHNKAFLNRPLQWESICIDRWYRQFRFGTPLEPLGDYDTIERVASLLAGNLWAYETKNEERFKRLLFEHHRHYLPAIGSDADNGAENPLPLSRLFAIDKLLAVSRPYLTPEEHAASRRALLLTLHAHPSLNPFLRQAIALEGFRL